MSSFDYILVGGGLQSGLLALALRARRPDAGLALVERGGKLGGNHTWCFHENDMPPESREWLAPLVAHRWPAYRILFPDHEHIIRESYSCVSSERLDEVVSASVSSHPGSELLLDSDVSSVSADGVRLRSGREIRATVVVDARGPAPLADRAPAGYQKFVGLELQLREPHGMDIPVVMDATLDQTDGFRFMYVLPFGERTVLVEDTYFSDTPELSIQTLRQGIGAYAAGRGWDVAGIEREESGVLPMPWAATIEPPGSGPLVAGYRGGWFHPGTGYSFPVATRLAEYVAGRPPDDLFGPDLVRFADRHRRQAAFAHLLNRLLFRWYPPHARRSIFERFYHLPRETIGNFYALRLSWRDRFRLLVGRPPKGLSIRHRFRPSLPR